MPVQRRRRLRCVTVTIVGANRVISTIANSSAGSTWKNSVTGIEHGVDVAAVVAREARRS